MKHLIAFLGYNQSRIQHPVYRQFIQAPIGRRNATLLFQSRPLEERELVHEVNELRRREGQQCELTFHLCATLDNPAMGQQIVQTAVLIHKLYDCPTFVYCMVPPVDRCTPEERNVAWSCLTALSNGVNDYPHLRLITHCFLYHDPSQRSLARFLYHITREPEAMDLLERYGYMGKLLTRRRTGDMSYVPEFPTIFSTFNASGIEYPDDEIRYFIHQSYLHALLSLSRPQTNPIDMERCNEHVDALLNALPLSDEQLTLNTESFIELPQSSKQKVWQPISQYWENCLSHTVKDLEDRPREEWLNQLKTQLNVYYQTRFREMGVEFFYKQQKKLTPDYCAVLLEQLRAGLRQVMMQNPYPPETIQDIVRSIVNHLQQQAMGFTKAMQESKTAISTIEASMNELTRTWDDMGFFDRMRGKDRATFDSYQNEILKFYIQKTTHQSAEFALKLLNELIPQIAAIPDTENRLGHMCQEALDSTQNYLDNNNPKSFIDPIFNIHPILEAADAICFDHDALYEDYKQLLAILYGQQAANSSLLEPYDSESLLQQLRDTLSEQIDLRIHQRIKDGTMTAVLDVNIMERLSAIYAEQGGLSAMIDRLKKESALTLKLKGEGGRNEQYLLIAPDCKGLDIPYILSSETSSVQMLHILTAISLKDLDGFAGQRMFVEPSMF